MNLITPRSEIRPVISQLDGLPEGKVKEYWDGRQDAKVFRPGVILRPDLRVCRRPLRRRLHGDIGAFSASGLFYLTFRDILQNDTAVDLLADTMKVALFTNSITTPNFDTNTAYAAAPFNANEVSGTGYTAGGAAVANDTITVSSGTLVYDGDDTSWTSSTFSSVRGGLLYDDTITTPVADPAVMAVTFGADYAVTAGTFTIQWSASGIFTIDLTP